MAFSNETIPKNQQKKEKLIKYWNGIVNKPKCIVFDLDMTLWPFLIDNQIFFPFSKVNCDGNMKILDGNKNDIEPYEDVSLILDTLKNDCFQNKEFLAIASRATAGSRAIKLIDLYEWTDYFDSIQIYSGNKQKHMKQIKKELNLKSFDQILFFDDSKLNLEATKSLGVIGHKVTRHYGLNLEEILNGLKNYNCNFLSK